MSKEYKCEECGKSFDSERGLHIHIGEVHPDKKEELISEEDTSEKSENQGRENRERDSGKQEERELKLSSKDKESFLDFGGGSKSPLIAISLIGIVLVALFVFGSGIVPGFSPAMFQGESNIEDSGALTAQEAGQRAVELYKNVPQLQNAHVSLQNASETGSGVYKVNLDIQAGNQSRNFPLYVSKDGVLLFPQNVKIEESNSEKISAEEAGRIAKEEMEKILSKDPRVNQTTVKFINSSGIENGLYALNIEVTAQGRTQRLKSFITTDGKFLFIRAANITAQLNQIEQLKKQASPNLQN